MKAALSLRAKSGAWVVGTGNEGQWIATGYALAMTRVRYGALCLSLLGESEVIDAAIHRGSGIANGFVCSLTKGQWIATGYALAMTRVRER